MFWLFKTNFPICIKKITSCYLQHTPRNYNEIKWSLNQKLPNTCVPCYVPLSQHNFSPSLSVWRLHRMGEVTSSAWFQSGASHQETHAPSSKGEQGLNSLLGDPESEWWRNPSNFQQNAPHNKSTLCHISASRGVRYHTHTSSFYTHTPLIHKYTHTFSPCNYSFHTHTHTHTHTNAHTHAHTFSLYKHLLFPHRYTHTLNAYTYTYTFPL